MGGWRRIENERVNKDDARTDSREDLGNVRADKPVCDMFLISMLTGGSVLSSAD